MPELRDLLPLCLQLLHALLHFVGGVMAAGDQVLAEGQHFLEDVLPGIDFTLVKERRRKGEVKIRMI